MADEPQPAEAQPAAAAKLPISARIFVDFKAVGDWGKLFDKSVTLLSIVEWLLKKAAARAPQGLIFRSVEACVSEEALARRGRELDNDDLSDITVATLYDHFGRFLKVFCDLDCSGGAASATPLPSGVNEIMETQRREPRALPASPDGARYDYRLFRALLSNLQCERLSFPKLDADVSGKRMLTALAEALQYVLPFDDAENSHALGCKLWAERVLGTFRRSGTLRLPVTIPQDSPRFPKIPQDSPRFPL
jgi:hypothetical protein